MTDHDYKDDLVLLTNTSAQAEPLLHSLELAVGGIGLYVNANKSEYMCFKQGTISTLSGKHLKLVDQFPHLSSNISPTEKDVNIHLLKGWNLIHGLSIPWKSDLLDKIKLGFFQAVAVSILLYGCITWMLKKNKRIKS